MEGNDVHFRRVFVEFVILLTKFGLYKYFFLALQLNVGERAVFALYPPPPFTPKTD